MARAVLCVCLAALLASSKAYVRAQGEDDYEGAEGEDFFDGSENEGDFMDVGDPYGGYDEYGGDFMDGLGGGMGEEEEANPGDHIRGFLKLDDLTFDKFVLVRILLQHCIFLFSNFLYKVQVRLPFV